MATLHHGRIVWAVMRDRKGGNDKRRPGVIISEDREIAADGSFFVVAISTSISEPLSEWEVLLPWNSSGTTRTKLRKKAVAVCNWLAELSPNDVEDHGGVVPTKLLNEILELASRLPD